MDGRQAISGSTYRALQNSVVSLPFVAALIFCIILQAFNTSLAAEYIYTPTNTDTDQWSAGTNWTATPVSDPSTELTFVGDNATVLDDGLSNINTNDIVGPFSLNVLNLQGTAPASGPALININSSCSDNYLNFVSNGSTTPMVNLNAFCEGCRLYYNINSNINLSNDTTITSNNYGLLNINGVVSGSGGLTVTGQGWLTLNAANTYSGTTSVLDEGGIILANSNALQNSTLDYNSSGNINIGGFTSITLGGLKGSGGLSLAKRDVYFPWNASPIALVVGNNNESTLYGGSITACYEVASFNHTISPITKIGTGTLTLTGSVSSYCPITVSQGAVQIGDGTTNGNVKGKIINNASLILNNGSDINVSNCISGTGTVTKTGTGTVSLVSIDTFGKTKAVTNSYTGATIIDGGTLCVWADYSLGSAPTSAQTNIIFSGNSTLQWGTNFELNSNRQINIGSGATATFDIAEQYENDNYNAYMPGSTSIVAAISGDGNLLKTNGGKLALTGTNTYKGTTTVATGTLEAATTNSLPGYNTPGKVQINDGGTLAVSVGGADQWNEADIATLRSNATFCDGSAIGFDTTDASDGFTYSGILKGNIGLTKTGTGSLTFTNPQDYFGPTNISGGQLVLEGGEDCLPTTTAVTLGTGGGLVINQNQTIASLSGSGGGGGSFLPPFFRYAGVIVSEGSTLIFGDSSNTTYSGGFEGGGQIIKRGTGTFTVTGISHHSYSGNITISEGTLQCEAFLPAPVTNNSVIVFNLPQTHQASTGSPSSTTVYISGSGTVSKIGAGIFTLGHPTTYFGDTTICGGQYVLNHTYALQNSTLDYDNYGGVLGFDTITAVTFGGLKGSQYLTLSNSSSDAVELSVGNNDQSMEYSGVLDGNGSLVKIGSGVLTLSGENCYAGVTTVEDGTLALGIDNVY